MIDAMKSYRTQLNSALTRARAANDLSEGGSAAESRLAQMSSEDCFNLLTSFYKVMKLLEVSATGLNPWLTMDGICLACNNRGAGPTKENTCRS